MDVNDEQTEPWAFSWVWLVFRFILQLLILTSVTAPPLSVVMHDSASTDGGFLSELLRTWMGLLVFMPVGMGIMGMVATILPAENRIARVPLFYVGSPLLVVAGIWVVFGFRPTLFAR